MPGDCLTLMLAQLNPTVGDVAGNCGKLIALWREAERRKAELLIASELFVSGYTPEDYAANPNLLKAVKDAVVSMARKTASGPAVLLGAPWMVDGRLTNAALLLDGGSIVATVVKHDLPNYGPFDEKRVYEPGPMAEPIVFRNIRLGVMICEDMWKPGPCAHARDRGAQILVVLNGSPFENDKQTLREELARQRVQETGLPLIYVNQVGGQDELLFEGSSFVLNAGGQICARAPAWQDKGLCVTLTHLQGELNPLAGEIEPLLDQDPCAYQGLMTGLRDYVTKNGFSSVLLGLSGGIDSAFTAALAVDALGPANVRTVMMPSPYTSAESLEDAQAVARALGCRLDTLPIAEAMQAFDNTLAQAFVGCTPDVTEENIQARCRGVLLMALSNKSGALLLSTGNKSELAVGYATLYGDMCGAFAPLKDVYKTVVYRLARERNERAPALALGPKGPVMPERVFTKPPSAELRPGQKDQDSLPPYPVLDGILACLIEDDLSVSDVVLRGYESQTVRKVWNLLGRAEYKRRQAPPGPKITKRHLTRDRRYPITNIYAEK